MEILDAMVDPKLKEGSTFTMERKNSKYGFVVLGSSPTFCQLFTYRLLCRLFFPDSHLGVGGGELGRKGEFLQAATLAKVSSIKQKGRDL